MAFNKAKALQQAESSVAAGKTSQAIRQYLDIVAKDPTEVALLNTIGDLYVREKNVAEGLRQFHKLADAYVQEGFNVKAIAIYKKIAKLDSNTIDPLLKLAELYLVQGLGREAREQYMQAAEFYKKKKDYDKALEVMRKIVAVDPENATVRGRLAMFAEQVGRKDEASQIYAETAELAIQRNDLAAADPAIKKAVELDPKNPRVQLLRARVALAKNKPDEVEKIISSSPDLKAEPAAKELLLRAYLANHKADEAEHLVLDVYRSNPSDFSPVASFASLCMEKGDFDTACEPLAALADQLIQQKNTAPLMESLKQIWSKTSNHLPTLELLYRVCERTADEFTLPEVLEALGHAYVQEGDLEKAEQAYQKLVNREPENENYKDLLKQVLQKAGKEVVPSQAAELARGDVPLSLEPEAPVAPATDEAEEAALKEALENSDIYARYNLPEKAVAELEKVLATYPDQLEIHKRILEICRKNLPERATKAAQALSRIYAKQGDGASASKYEEVAVRLGGPEAIAEAPAPVAEPLTATTKQEFDLSAGPAPETTEAAEVPTDAAAPTTSPFEDSGASDAAPPAAASSQEIDLSGDWEATVAAPGATPPPAPVEPAQFNFEDSSAEVGFYLDNGFPEEAQKVVSDLEAKFPGHAQVLQLRKRVDQAAALAASKPPSSSAAPTSAVESAPASLAAASGDWDLPDAYASATAVPLEPTPNEPPPAPAVAPEPAPLPEPVASTLPPEPPAPPPPQPVAPVPPQPVAAAPSPAPEAAPPQPATAAASASGGDLLGDLAGSLASSFEGLDDGGPPPPPSNPSPRQPATAAGAGISPLSDLLQEMEEPAAAGASQKDDPETNYNLGVAFREMGLLDEAIGEFQKIVKGTGKGNFPPHFLQACTLLATCFMDKKMPAVAAKWYSRALETPDLDDEATLALQYDLGAAYEQAGDTRTALEKFTEVYSQNIDFRDVAEKIRVLQQKV